MPTIGIFSKTPVLFDKFRELTFEDTEVISITTSDCLSEPDIVVINSTADDWFLETITWLVAIKEYSKIFPWVLAPQSITSNEEEILLSLGAISVLEQEDKYNSIVYSIRNTFYRIKEENEKIGILTFLNDRIVSFNGNEKKLTKMEYSLLHYLYRNRNATVSYNDIYQNVWEGNFNYNPENSRLKIANIIFRLRKLINGTKNLEIITVRERGYMLVEKK